MSRIWDDLITAEDRAVFEESGHGQGAGLGQRPALLVVDVTHNFTGDKPEPIRESIRRFPLSCGERAWQALPQLHELIETARAASIPVIYTRQAPRPARIGGGGWARKNSSTTAAPSEISVRIGNEIPKIIAPAGDDIVIEKDKPSAFFGTLLESYLNTLNVDSLIVTGTVTSGCVRATVVDAFSLNYPTVVVEECCFDRGQVSHKMSLFDMNQKYADVMSLAAVKALINQLSSTTPKRAVAAR